MPRATPLYSLPPPTAQTYPPARLAPDLTTCDGLTQVQRDLPHDDDATLHRRSHTAAFRSGLRHRVLNFTPSWFSVNMGTGISSILLYRLPYQASALQWIGVGIFGLNSVLFVIFLAMSLARYLYWPSVFRAMVHHPQQSLFLGTIPMGFATLVNMTAFVCVPAWGPRWADVAWFLWWCEVALTLLVGLWVPWVMFTRHKHSVEGLNAVWLQPVVAAVVTASSGGVVADVLEPRRARLTIIASYAIFGMGFPVAFLIMSLYFLRLTVHNPPPREAIVSMFLPLGPCGQGAFALLQLSSQIYRLAYAPDSQGIFQAGAGGSQEAQVIASAVYGVSVLVALVLWGLGAFWLVTAVMTTLEMLTSGGFPFNLGWWGFTFPLGVYAVATNTLGAELDSTAFKVLGTFFSACVVLLWLYIAARTTVRAIKGTMFVAPCLAPTGGEPPTWGSR